MRNDLQLFPEQASALAPHVDYLFFFLIAVSVFFATGIVLVLFFFAVRYRRGQKVDRTDPVLSSLPLELTWTLIPLAIVLVIFVWGALVFYRDATPIPGAMEIYVVGKQWMWKVMQPNGRREINEIHVPLGRAVRLTMTSEDVIHDVYIPAFRTKKDVLPGRYTRLWFQPTKVGTYHLFCAEYCGTGHSRMIGNIIVMPPADYERWLSGGVSTEAPEQAGERLFEKLACITCHRADSKGRGPSLVGLYGTEVALQDGRSVIADENYLRESILQPAVKLVRGQQNIMPTFTGQVSEESILQLIAYIRSIGKEPKPDEKPAPRPESAPATR